MIYITGDMHGDIKQAEKIMKKIIIKPENILIILGDFGGNYYLNKKDEYFKNAINEYGIKIFAIRGNHDANPANVKNISLIKQYNGYGYIEEKFPNIFYAKNCQNYIIENNEFLVLGGAYSVDKWYRLENNKIWFPDEQMTEEEQKKFLEYYKNIKIDNILSHTCPYSIIPKHLFLPQINQSMVDNRTEFFLEEVKNKFHYNNWFFGHFHANEKFENNIYMLYDGVIHYKSVGDLKIY